ncbi:MAG: ABC-type transport auxiliary lipoprotein family protein [Pseudomonadota bacterium]
MIVVCRLPVFGIASLALLCGCSGLLRNEAAPDHIYVLHAAPATGSGQPLSAVVSVPRLAVAPGLDTDRIALLRGGNELDYYAASRFGEPLPKVLSALVLQSMNGGDGFATAVSTERAALPGDFELQLTVRRFEAEYAAPLSPPLAQVAIDCLLVAGAPRRVLGHCDAAATEPAGADRMSEIVLALERATQKALAEVRTKAVALAKTMAAKQP